MHGGAEEAILSCLDGNTVCIDERPDRERALIATTMHFCTSCGETATGSTVMCRK